ncbi:hypothetical protein PIB30_058271 [Stylosanthes scabra]|uniref:Uncharacterized protein n=1 Tax=Stylosanthes scabra TaxID=79078 RepID=A0ABU6UIZ5_9FABA|nr:hypothetical protein [Stylosanthes scabra]
MDCTKLVPEISIALNRFEFVKVAPTKTTSFSTSHPTKDVCVFASVSSTQTSSSSSSPKEVRENPCLQHNKTPLSINHGEDTASSVRALRLSHRRPSSLIKESVFIVARLSSQVRCWGDLRMPH